MNFQSLFAALVATTAVGWTVPGLDQPSPDEVNRSHRLLDGPDSPFQNPEAMAQRLRRARDFHDTESLIRKLLENEKVREQLPKVAEWLKKQGVQAPELLDNPELRRQLVDSLGKTGLTKQQLNELENLAKNSKPPAAASSPQPISPVPPAKSLPPSQPPPSTASEPARQDRVKQLLEQVTKKLDSLDPSNNNELVRDLVRHLTMLGNDLTRPVASSSSETKAVLDGLARMSEWLPLDKLSEINWGEMFPKWSLPEVPAPHGWSPGPAPSLGVSPESAGEGLIWLLLAVLMGVVVWRLAGKSSPVHGAGDQAWRPGPWPVSPARVTTRHDLIRAFEYLALLLLGPQAGACHHRELASRIGQSGNPATARHRQQAAEELALLYERARYAPSAGLVDQPLTNEDQALARLNLCLLAGMGGA